MSKRILLACSLQLTAYSLFFLAGCATAPLVTPAKPEGIPGIYHRVEKKQTLWKISQLYNVDLDELAAINRIPDAAKIEIGQLLFIPGRQRQESVPVKSGFEDFIWPLRGKVIAAFGQTFNNMTTKGINIQPIRSSEVVAARSGRVIFAADNFLGYGKTIIIDHGDGFSTVYARNSQVFIKVDDNIEKGMTIAKVGSSGRDKNVYLHFEIRKSHLAQNPYFYLP